MRNNIVEFPEGWHDLSSEQAKDVFELHLRHIADEISENDMRVLLVCKWLKLGFNFNYKHLLAQKTNNTDELEHMYAQIYRITQTMNWIYRTETVNRLIKRKMRKVKLKTLAYDGLDNFFPKVKTAHQEYYAPDPFYEIPVQQFIDVFQSFKSYYKTKDTDDLDRFFAQLYLPRRSDLDYAKLSPNFDGRYSEEYNPYTTDYHLEQLKEVSPAIKYGALLWFINYDRYLKTGEINVEGNTINMSSLFTGGDSDGESLGLTGVLLNIAEEGVFGTLDQVQKRPIIDIYVKLYNNHLKIKDAKK